MAQERSSDVMARTIAQTKHSWAEAELKVLYLQARVDGCTVDPRLAGMWEGQSIAFKQMSQIFGG